MAQVPQQFAFQGVARNSNGQAVTNQKVSVRFTIHQGAETGGAVFSEVQTPTTNAAGLFNVAIGSKTAFPTTLNWSNNVAYYLQVEIDPAGGSAYTHISTSQLLSVPYAVAASRLVAAGSTVLTTTGTTIGSSGNKALGNNATAMGDATTASAQNATAMGAGSKASGEGSLAAGANTNTPGKYAVAMGINAEASGEASFAAGRSTKATGVNSFATGNVTEASGENAFTTGNVSKATRPNTIAMGNTAEASGDDAFAAGSHARATAKQAIVIGNDSEAGGENAFAAGLYVKASAKQAVAIGANSQAMAEGAKVFGYNVLATGPYSTAMGTNVNTANHTGSFIIGDYRTLYSMSSSKDNQIIMRFGGGYRFYTGTTTNGADYGAALPPDGSSWVSISDSTRKENYRQPDGAAFLSKIKDMKIGSWNYKGQNKKTLRHYGPMAQEFYSLFGNDGIGNIGNDTTIASADIDGVMMIALQALVKQVDQLSEANKKLQQRVQQLEATKKDH
ncbi:Head domain of trimeric autotransporter adhesin [Niabella drilacis]|uniref:Head domain of trimeric autotransporter adhesin n=2 Tax=Niabella drilacis (strain DSM 25811 / CCM 8410 / CCUG 62505 / LMG 26954 / E90) TaxID=1285928 RepID=A0A1G6SHE6_NIADE|nr:Head domain of trimeric autotransporter adhesin [Niabella drilacis]